MLLGLSLFIFIKREHFPEVFAFDEWAVLNQFLW